MSSIAPGWYKDPADPATQRYWDGEGWLGTPIPADATPPEGPPPDAVPPAVAQRATGATGSPVADATDHPAAGATDRPAALNPGPVSPGPVSPGPAGPGAAGPGPVSPGPAGYAGPPPGPAPLGVPGTGPAPPPWIAPGGTLPPPIVLPPPPAPRPHGYRLAPYGSRLVARIIDILAVLVLNVAVNGWLVYQLLLEMAPMVREQLANPMAEMQPAPPRAQYLLYAILIIATALWFAYEVPAMANTGQTLGKRLMHIRVVPLENTEPLGFGRAFRRWARLGMWTPLWACFGIGLLFQLISAVSLLFDQPLRQALHDKLARTVVVEVPPGARPATDKKPSNRPKDRT